MAWTCLTLYLKIIITRGFVKIYLRDKVSFRFSHFEEKPENFFEKRNMLAFLFAGYAIHTAAKIAATKSLSIESVLEQTRLV